MVEQNRTRVLTAMPLAITPVIVAILVFVIDQISKALISASLGHAGQPDHVDIIGSWLRFSPTTNSGAAFGMFQDRTMFFTLVALVAVPALIYFHNSIPTDKWLARNCIGLLIGGTLGNLVDRVRLGYVIDFVDAGVGNLRWPTFNVADSAFVIGVFLLAFYFLTAKETSDAGGPS